MMTLVRLAAMVLMQLFILVGYTLQYNSLCIKTKQVKMRANYITKKCFNACICLLRKKEISELDANCRYLL